MCGAFLTDRLVRVCVGRWLGKNSTAGKSKRLLSELSVRMRAHASGSREVIRMDYVPYMKEILLQKLLSGEEVRRHCWCIGF